jgi:hypothetical protein
MEEILHRGLGDTVVTTGSGRVVRWSRPFLSAWVQFELKNRRESLP